MTIRGSVVGVVQRICELSRGRQDCPGGHDQYRAPSHTLQIGFPRSGRRGARRLAQVVCACVVALHLSHGLAVAHESIGVSLVPVSCLNLISPAGRAFEQDLSAHLRLVFRQSRDARWFVTSPRPIKNRCGIRKRLSVYSALTIPTLSPNQWSGVSFDCEDAAKILRPGMPLIGVFSRSENITPTKARFAWTVDMKTGKFRRLVDVSCNSFDQ
jgi:hypothetical protein